jgi:hypothetical protein
VVVVVVARTVSIANVDTVTVALVRATFFFCGGCGGLNPVRLCCCLCLGFRFLIYLILDAWVVHIVCVCVWGGGGVPTQHKTKDGNDFDVQHDKGMAK